MSFRRKVVWKKKKYTSVNDLIDRVFVVKAVLFWLVFVLGIYVFGQVLRGGKDVVEVLKDQTVKIVAERTWDSMVTDTLWNINVLLVWYAWEQERGWFLTDTIMVASFNPDIWWVTFLSLPRDLFVTYHKWGRGKLNWAYWAKYIDSNWDHEAAALFLRDKVSQITGIPLEYHVFVAFEGFVDFIDSLWGISIDVPYDLNDPYYPDNNNWYQTFTVNKGYQDFDWETALKYARSRKTTSDFSRTLRQQQIIKAIVFEIIENLWITNISGMKKLYNEAMSMIETNISIKEIIWMLKYSESEKRFFSFVYTSDCDKRYFELTSPWCVLYLGNKDDFNGQSVVIPVGSTPGNINYYKHTKDFAFWVIYNQEFLSEDAPVRVLNWIDKDRAKTNDYSIEWIATKLWIQLKAQAFNVVDIANSDIKVEKSILYVQDEEGYARTIDMIKTMIDIDEVRTDGIGELSEWVNIILWNDYVLKE